MTMVDHFSILCKKQTIRYLAVLYQDIFDRTNLKDLAALDNLYILEGSFDNNLIPQSPHASAQGNQLLSS